MTIGASELSGTPLAPLGPLALMFNQNQILIGIGFQLTGNYTRDFSALGVNLTIPSNTRIGIRQQQNGNLTFGWSNPITIHNIRGTPVDFRLTSITFNPKGNVVGIEGNLPYLPDDLVQRLFGSFESIANEVLGESGRKAMGSMVSSLRDNPIDCESAMLGLALLGVKPR